MMRVGVSTYAEEVRENLPDVVQVTVYHLLKINQEKNTSKIGQII
jgi:hypothetical protein